LYPLNDHNIENVKQNEDKHYKIHNEAKEVIESLIYEKTCSFQYILTIDEEDEVNLYSSNRMSIHKKFIHHSRRL
jgi:hypothetical protein